MAKKKRKNAIPKSVAGIKVPKQLRKSRLLKALLASPLGRDILAKALTAGVGAAAAVLVEERKEVASAGKEGVRDTSRAVEIGAEAARSAFHAAIAVVAAAAAELVPDHQHRRKRRNDRGAEVVTH